MVARFSKGLKVVPRLKLNLSKKRPRITKGIYKPINSKRISTTYMGFSGSILSNIDTKMAQGSTYLEECNSTITKNSTIKKKEQTSNVIKVLSNLQKLSIIILYILGAFKILLGILITFITLKIGIFFILLGIFTIFLCRQ